MIEVMSMSSMSILDTPEKRGVVAGDSPHIFVLTCPRDWNGGRTCPEVDQQSMALASDSLSGELYRDPIDQWSAPRCSAFR